MRVPEGGGEEWLAVAIGNTSKEAQSEKSSFPEKKKRKGRETGQAVGISLS